MDRESCIVKGNDAEECQNYIKVLQQYNNDPDRYMICGTNAYRPSCRQYIDERGSYVLREETAGKLIWRNFSEKLPKMHKYCKNKKEGKCRWFDEIFPRHCHNAPETLKMWS